MDNTENTQMSSSQLLIFQGDDGKLRVEARLEGETVWLTQRGMSELFGVGVPAISKHLKNIFEEGELDEKVVVSILEIPTRHGAIPDKTQMQSTQYYNLDAIISVGYRVNSRRATQFRQWATKVLTEYIKKGFVLNDERLKNGNNLQYFNELQERLREIRLSERVFYQKIKDIYTTSIDYDAHDERTLAFFKTVQNKLLWAISKQTAAELVMRRSNAALPFMGMTSYSKKNPMRISKQDAMTAKNYLTEDEMKSLGLLVEQYLAFAEAQAMQHIPMTMNDWIKRLDMILAFNGRELLHHAGSISHDLAKETAIKRLGEYRTRLAEEEHEESLKELERDLSDSSK